MGTTANYALRYPEPVDTPNVPRDMQNLANDADSLLLGRDAIVAAATRVISSKLLVGDSQPAFRIFGDGKIEWGPGGSTVPDTNLYRSAANTLMTDSVMRVAGTLTVNATSGVATQVKIDYDGGGNARLNLGETDLVRVNSDMVGTNHNFYVAAGKGYYTPNHYIAEWDSNILFVPKSFMSRGQYYYLGHGTTNGTIYFGSALDTTLQRTNTNQLATGGDFWVSQGNNGTGAGSRLYFGASAENFLYRFDGNNIGVSNSLYVNGWQTIVSALYLGSPGDCSIYRSGSWGLNLHTDQVFYCQGIQGKQGINNGTNGYKYNFCFVGGSNVEVWIDATNMGNIAGLSDRRLKKAIKPLASSWEIVKAMQPVTFRWGTTHELIRDDGRTHTGLVAQDLKELDPDLIHETRDENGVPHPDQPMSLNMPAVVATLANALKEAMTRIEKLEAA